MAVEKSAVVTGAGTGIGRAAALALAKVGYAVGIVGRRKDMLEETAKMAGGAKMLVLAHDVGKPDEVKALFEKVKQEFGRLDVLFNNAGMGAPPVPMEDLTYEQWSAVVAVNLTGPFLCAQQAIKIMKDQKPQGGRIINNGSILRAYAAPVFLALQPRRSTRSRVSRNPSRSTTAPTTSPAARSTSAMPRPR